MQIFKDSNKFKKLVISMFMFVPVLSSLISSIHLVDLFELGNYSWMSYVLAFAFEIGSIAAFLVLSILDKANKGMIWFVFIMLTFMQILGNIYFSYDYIYNALLIDPNWLKSFQEMVYLFIGDDTQMMKLTLSTIIGLPIPLVSLFLLKSLADYIQVTDEGESNIDLKEDENTLSDEEVTELLSLMRNKFSDSSGDDDAIEDDISNVDNDLKSIIVDENYDNNISDSAYDEKIKTTFDGYEHIKDNENDISIIQNNNNNG